MTNPDEQSLTRATKKMLKNDSEQRNEILVTNMDRLTTKDSLLASFYQQQGKTKATIENFIEQNFEGGLSDFDVPEANLFGTQVQDKIWR